MPKLPSRTIEFTCYDRNTYREYSDWSFYYQHRNESKEARSILLEQYWDLYYDTITDQEDLQRPRTEWVFACPCIQLQWEEPEEAKALWLEKCPEVDFDFVTVDRAREHLYVCARDWGIESKVAVLKRGSLVANLKSRHLRL
jgi:hypothetical protein